MARTNREIANIFELDVSWSIEGDLSWMEIFKQP